MNQEYEKLYSKAVTEVMAGLEKIKPSTYTSDREIIAAYLCLWADIVEKFALPSQHDLDLEAVEAIRRSYQKQN